MKPIITLLTALLLAPLAALHAAGGPEFRGTTDTIELKEKEKQP